MLLLSSVAARCEDCFPRKQRRRVPIFVSPTQEELSSIAFTVVADGGGSPCLPGQTLLLSVSVRVEGRLLLERQIEYDVNNEQLDVAPTDLVAPALLARCVQECPAGSTIRCACDGRFVNLAEFEEDWRGTQQVEVEVSVESCAECGALPDCCQGLGVELTRRTLRAGCAEAGAGGPVFGSTALCLVDGESTARELKLGAGETCDALEIGLLTMQQGETVRFFGDACFFSHAPLSTTSTFDARRGLVVELVAVHRALSQSASLAESLRWGRGVQEVATRLLSAGRFVLALVQFVAVAEFLESILEHQRCLCNEATLLIGACRLGSAECYLKLKSWGSAISMCDLLPVEERDARGHLMIARARLGAGELQEAKRALHVLLQADPGHLQAKQILSRVKEKQKAGAVREKVRTQKVMQRACQEGHLSGGSDHVTTITIPDAAAELQKMMFPPGKTLAQVHRSWGRTKVANLLEQHERKEQQAKIAEEFGISLDEAADVQMRGGL